MYAYIDLIMPTSDPLLGEAANLEISFDSLTWQKAGTYRFVCVGSALLLQ